MKKQTVLAMAMAFGIAGTTCFPAQAAGTCNSNGGLPSNTYIVVNGQACDLSDAKNTLKDLYDQLQNGKQGSCPTVTLPDCNSFFSNNGKLSNDSNCTPSNSDNNKSSNNSNCTPSNSDNNKPSNNSSCTPSNNYNGKTSNNTGCTDREIQEDTQTEEKPSTVPGTEASDNDQSGKNDEQTQAPNHTQSEESQNKSDIPDSSKPESTTQESTTEAQKTENETLSYAERILKLVNEERAKAGLHALKLDTEICSAASVRVNEIQSSFSHTRPDGRKFSTALTDMGIRYTGAGENIAWGQTSPEQVMEAWMNSEGHRANILNAKFTKIGIGHARNANGRDYWVQLFTY